MIAELVQTMEDWLLAMADSFWVFPALLGFATIDGFFPPVPSESAVIALASLGRSSGQPNLGLVLLFAALGAFAGDQIAYQIGSRINVRRLGFMRSARAQAALDWAERSLERRGASFIIAARYVPVGRVAVNMTAGAVGFHRPRFVALTAIAAVTWACYSAAIGIVSGSLLEGRPLLAIAVGVVGGVLLGVVVDRVIQWLTGGEGPAEDGDGAPRTGPAGASRRGTVPASPDPEEERPVSETLHRNAVRVRDVLTEMGVTGQVRQLVDSTRTAREAAEALGVPVGAICSSLVFLLDGEPLLVLTSGAHRVDTEMLGEALGGTVTRADADAVRAATGQPIGGVAPVGHPAPLRTVVDVALEEFEVVWAAAGHPHAVFPTSFAELLRITGGEPRVVGP